MLKGELEDRKKGNIRSWWKNRLKQIEKPLITVNINCIRSTIEISAEQNIRKYEVVQQSPVIATEEFDQTNL